MLYEVTEKRVIEVVYRCAAPGRLAAISTAAQAIDGNMGSAKSSTCSYRVKELKQSITELHKSYIIIDAIEWCEIDPQKNMGIVLELHSDKIDVPVWLLYVFNSIGIYMMNPAVDFQAEPVYAEEIEQSSTLFIKPTEIAVYAYTLAAKLFGNSPAKLL